MAPRYSRKRAPKWMLAAFSVSIALSAPILGSDGQRETHKKRGVQTEYGQSVFPVVINAMMDSRTALDCGTGFFINKDLKILTADHVIKKLLARIETERAHSNRLLYITAVLIRVGGGATLPLTVVKEDADLDLALLKPTDLNFPLQAQPLEIETTPAQVGDELEAIGYPLLLPYTQSEATSEFSGDDSTLLAMTARLKPIVTYTRPVGWIPLISRLAPLPSDSSMRVKSFNQVNLMILDHALMPGNSGGPIVSVLTGKVVGIAPRTSGAYSFAVGAPDLQRFLESSPSR